MVTSKSRQLAAILFADIVGYTALMQKDEADAIVILSRFQEVIKTNAESFDGEIIKTYGDGTLLLFSSTVDAVECAQDIQIAFQEAPKVPLRIGIHVGEFVRKGNDIFGNGINIAARIESIGVAGSVLFSQDVAKRIKNHPEFETLSLGEFQFKHVDEIIEVFALTNDNFAIPNQANIKGKIKPPITEHLKWLIPAIMGTFLLGLFAFWQFNTPKKVAPKTVHKELITSPKIQDNSIAVLPFANMSFQKEKDYFSEGIHDDVLSKLSKIGNMKVISRTSVLRFKDTKQPLFEVANMLGVANILEGSVRRAGNQLRINVQLIKAKTGNSIWSESYDRALTTDNIFNIQAEIAQEIAAALETSISSSQQVALTDRPTQNLAAYEAYLKGRHLVEERTGKAILEAKQYLEEAIKLDPNFAQAYIKLGEVAYLSVEYASADSKTNYALAWDYLEKAKNINPNLAEIYGLECTLYHYDKGDIENARRAYVQAITINPNYADVYFWYSHAEIEIEKDFELSLAILENAMRLNPLSPKFINRLAQTYMDNGKNDLAIKAYAKGIELAPNHIFLPRNLTFLYAHHSQLDSAAITAYETVQRISNEPKYLRTYIYTLAQLNLQEEVAAEMENFRMESRQDSLFYYKRQENYALLQGDFETAEKYLQLLTVMDKDAQNNDPALAANIYYYKKDFQKVVTLFEQQYPDVLTTDYFKNTMFSGYNRQLGLQEKIQQYIYSLQQIGQTTKANQLFEKYASQIIANVNPKGDQIWEARKREFFKVRNALFNGEIDLAMEQLANYYHGKVMPDWHYLSIDPIFETVKNDARYVAVVDNIQADVAQQRDVFRNYLMARK